MDTKRNWRRWKSSKAGICHDNASIEFFFNLLKRGCLNKYQINMLIDLRKLVSDYVKCFNNVRTPRNKNDLTPVKYRHQAMSA
ncbi:IS3 family transposase [Liquorilactobacillus nagelii]|uniref:IS3 family transposase n=1 Tax=Liquorilactobacillus nagelii TaxID=82688 RepID=UPI0012EE9E1F|nr:IS3 family transposase [Liquorilactobacillus nagelii DSM 13675]